MNAMMAPYDRPIVCPKLIGRMPQLDGLCQCIDVVGGGSGAIVFISGEAGIGKSRLIIEAITYAITQGCAVLRGACFPHDVASPYALFVDILRTQFVHHNAS